MFGRGGAGEVSKREEFLKAKTAEAENSAKQLALLNFTVKDLQKQLTTAQTEAAGWTREREETRAQVGPGVSSVCCCVVPPFYMLIGAAGGPRLHEYR